jgi:hypothetical protein
VVRIRSATFEDAARKSEEGAFLHRGAGANGRLARVVRESGRCSILVRVIVALVTKICPRHLMPAGRWPGGASVQRESLTGERTRSEKVLDSLVVPSMKHQRFAEQESLSLAAICEGLLPEIMSGELRARDAKCMVEASA